MFGADNDLLRGWLMVNGEWKKQFCPFTIYHLLLITHVSSRAPQKKRREEQALLFGAAPLFRERVLVNSITYYLLAGALGAPTFTSTFVVPPPPPINLPRNKNKATKITIIKITSTATTPVLPLPPPLPSAIKRSSFRVLSAI